MSEYTADLTELVPIISKLLSEYDQNCERNQSAVQFIKERLVAGESWLDDFDNLGAVQRILNCDVADCANIYAQAFNHFKYHSCKEYASSVSERTKKVNSSKSFSLFNFDFGSLESYEPLGFKINKLKENPFNPSTLKGILDGEFDEFNEHHLWEDFLNSLYISLSSGPSECVEIVVNIYLKLLDHLCGNQFLECSLSFLNHVRNIWCRNIPRQHGLPHFAIELEMIKVPLISSMLTTILKIIDKLYLHAHVCPERIVDITLATLLIVLENGYVEVEAAENDIVFINILDILIVSISKCENFFLFLKAWPFVSVISQAIDSGFLHGLFSRLSFILELDTSVASKFSDSSIWLERINYEKAVYWVFLSFLSLSSAFPSLCLIAFQAKGDIGWYWNGAVDDSKWKLGGNLVKITTSSYGNQKFQKIEGTPWNIPEYLDAENTDHAQGTKLVSVVSNILKRYLIIADILYEKTSLEDLFSAMNLLSRWPSFCAIQDEAISQLWSHIVNCYMKGVNVEIVTSFLLQMLSFLSERMQLNVSSLSLSIMLDISDIIFSNEYFLAPFDENKIDEVTNHVMQVWKEYFHCWVLLTTSGMDLVYRSLKEERDSTSNIIQFILLQSIRFSNIFINVVDEKLVSASLCCSQSNFGFEEEEEDLALKALPLDCDSLKGSLRETIERKDLFGSNIEFLIAISHYFPILSDWILTNKIEKITIWNIIVILMQVFQARCILIENSDMTRIFSPLINLTNDDVLFAIQVFVSLVDELNFEDIRDAIEPIIINLNTSCLYDDDKHYQETCEALVALHRCFFNRHQEDVLFRVWRECWEPLQSFCNQNSVMSFLDLLIVNINSDFCNDLSYEKLFPLIVSVSSCLIQRVDCIFPLLECCDSHLFCDEHHALDEFSLIRNEIVLLFQSKMNGFQNRYFSLNPGICYLIPCIFSNELSSKTMDAMCRNGLFAKLQHCLSSTMSDIAFPNDLIHRVNMSYHHWNWNQNTRRWSVAVWILLFDNQTLDDVFKYYWLWDLICCWVSCCNSEEDVLSVVGNLMFSEAWSPFHESCCLGKNLTSILVDQCTTGFLDTWSCDYYRFQPYCTTVIDFFLSHGASMLLSSDLLVALTNNCYHEGLTSYSRFLVRICLNTFQSEYFTSCDGIVQYDPSELIRKVLKNITKEALSK